MDYENVSDHELFRRAERGDDMAAAVLRRREEGDDDDGCLLYGLLLAVPLMILYLLVKALAGGTLALANDSVLAPLFPRPGDSLLRYVVSSLTLMLLVPGSLVVLAHLVQHGRAHALRWLLLPLAVIAVPALLLVGTATSTAPAVLLPT